MSVSFDVEKARSYWRFVPSGEGKHDTAELLKLPDKQLEEVWDRAFASRFLRYPEEDCFARIMAKRFAGKRVLSIGSGLGFHELYYQGHRAQVTCVDIVKSNLQIIERLTRIKQLPPVRTILADDTTQLDSAGLFDVGFVYGSLMTMPLDGQRELLASIRRVLTRNGSIVLMLYTWKFAATTCGWNSTAQFDPSIFARASDPSVGDQHCPWSDWHDDSKILDLAGADMAITHRQLWQDGLFVWYALSPQRSKAEPQNFFPSDLVSQGLVVEELFSNVFRPVSSKTTVTENGLQIKTSREQFAYAVMTTPKRAVVSPSPPNAVRSDLTVFSGGLSVGILDTRKQVFVNTTTATVPGRHTVLLPFSPEPQEYQIVFSNHRPDGPGQSSFCIHRVELTHRQSVVDSPLKLRTAIQIAGGTAAPAELHDFFYWLQCFPPGISDACRDWIESNPLQTWIVPHLAELANFRMAPATCLKRVLRTLRYAWERLPNPGRVIWAVENHENRGLDDFEADAIFGTFLDIDFVHQVDRGSPISRLVVAGVLRQEIAGLAFTLDRQSLRSRSALKESLSLLVQSELPIVTVFLDHDTACDLLQNVDDELVLELRRLVKQSGLSLGLYVPEHRMHAVRESLKFEVEPLVKLAGHGHPVDHIRFQRSDFLDVPGAAEKLFEAGFRWDSSTSVCSSDAFAQPYVRGAYQALDFDPLSPTGLWRQNQWVESPLVRVTNLLSNDVWSRGRFIETRRLARLLDFKRMEKFYRRASEELSLNRTYHDYRIYNWPPADPSPRTTLIDCGDLSDVSFVRSTIDAFRHRRKNIPSHVAILGHQDFLAAATEESRRRTSESVGKAIQAQLDAHSYLAGIPEDSPLREDIRDFVRFLPERLGSTLELGSGTGQLAQALFRRCDNYTCTEVGPLSNVNGIQALKADVHALPFRDAVFTTVIANNTLEHLYDPLMCLKEVFRVLIPGGHLYALIPLDGLNPKHQVRTHLWKATEKNIRHAIENAGLIPVRMDLMNLYQLGINAAFPSCNGLVCKLEAQRRRNPV